MVFQAGGKRPEPRPMPSSPAAQAYLRDYATFLGAVPFPSAVVNHRWDVRVSNSAYETLFRAVAPHPTAMPSDNFLRFTLFHPDADGVLGDREQSWCLPLLADFAAAMERYGQDRGLQAIRREIAQDPLMDAAYRQGLPHWIRAVGESTAYEHDGALRPLLHPDPRWGATECRVVMESSMSLEALGYRRMTLVLREPLRVSSRFARRARARARARAAGRGGAAHLAVVPPWRS